MPLPRESFRVVHNGVEMEVLALGQGDPVVLIHGFTASKESWFFNMEALGSHFRVLAPDLPGYGQSTKVVENPPIAFYASWIHRLLDQQGIESAHLVGNSMGGAIAMELALQDPKRVRKLVLVDTLGFGGSVVPGVGEKLVNSSTRDEVKEMIAMVIHDPALIIPAVVDRAFQYRQEPGVPALLKRVAAQLSDGTRPLVDYSPRLKQLTMPVLVVWGREDRVLPVSDISKAKALPHGRVHVFEACGHMPQLEKALEFNALVTQFLKEG